MGHGLSSASSPVAEMEGLDGGVGQSGTLEFLGIDNIHVMRDSEKKLKEICHNLGVQDKSWLAALDHTRCVSSLSSSSSLQAGRRTGGDEDRSNHPA